MAPEHKYPCDSVLLANGANGQKKLVFFVFALKKLLGLVGCIRDFFVAEHFLAQHVTTMQCSKCYSSIKLEM